LGFQRGASIGECPMLQKPLNNQYNSIRKEKEEVLSTPMN
jgi:hypothetical protein